MTEHVGKAKILFEGWINRADGTREYITGESEEVTEEFARSVVEAAGLPKPENTYGTDS